MAKPVRNHRWIDEYQFWIGLISILFVVVSGVWHMSSRLTTIENNIATQMQRTETGFSHVSRSITKLNRDKDAFDSRIREIFRSCCSELHASLVE